MTAGTKAVLCPGGGAALNISVLLAVFPVVFLGELPDKTMFASLVLSTKGRPAMVWLGVAATFAVHVAIAVSVVVALFTILPRRAVDAVVAVIFLVGAGLAIRERQREDREEQTPGPPLLIIGGQPRRRLSSSSLPSGAT